MPVRRQSLSDFWTVFLERVIAPLCGYAAFIRFSYFPRSNVKRLTFLPASEVVRRRPLRLHDARHSYASLAIASGESVRWVASQLDHANPELTLRVYAMHCGKRKRTSASSISATPDDTAAAPSAVRSLPTKNPSAQLREGALECWSTRPGSQAAFARFALAEQSSAGTAYEEHPIQRDGSENSS